MNQDHATSAASAYESLAAAGLAITFSRKPLTSVSSAGKPTFGTATTATSVAIQLDPADGKGMPGAWGKDLHDGTLVGRELAFFWVAASGMAFAPQALDTCTFNGITWEVLGCYRLSPAGTPILYGVGTVRA